MKFGSLFAGVGGIDLGLERAGMECVWQVEIDDYCTRVLEKHWPEIQRFGNIRECGDHNLAPVDLIAGGFPCQPHSVAGKRRGAEDDRNLWPEFRRVIAELRPRYVLAENVPGIVTTYIDTVLSDLESEGYACATFNLPAVAFDAPHRRERIFIVGYASEFRRDEASIEGPEKDREPEGETGRSSSTITDGDVADTNRAWELQPQRDERTQRRRSSNSGMGNSYRSSKNAYAETGRSRKAIGESSWWTAEPDVGRVASRISASLDGIGIINAHKRCYAKARTAGLPRVGRVRTVWLNEEPTTPPSRSERCVVCESPLSGMPYGGSLEGWLLGTGAEEDQDLRGLWEAVFKLQSHEGQDLWEELFERAGAAKRIQAMASRVNQLRGLGNAVVPQVAEWIGKRIMEFDEQAEAG